MRYDPSPDVPGHAVNWKTGACTRTARYCRRYDMKSYDVQLDTRGASLFATDLDGACSETDDRRAVCTCGKSGAQKFGAFFVGDTIQGAVAAKLQQVGLGALTLQ